MGSGLDDRAGLPENEGSDGRFGRSQPGAAESHVAP